MAMKQTECSHCGTCCANGGPALHMQDRELIEGGSIPISHLITIRKGELVHNPVTNRLQAAKSELIKINGVGKKTLEKYGDDILSLVAEYRKNMEKTGGTTDGQK
jgi:Fe-S-cluster containining protein